MPNFREYPRGGVANSPIENGGEVHLPCALLVDTSSSMDLVKDQLRQGLIELGETLDELAKGRVEFCIIGFDNNARILVPFGPAYDYEVPDFDCDGMTAMHAAIDLALCELEARKQQYKANNTAYYRPWIFMLTCGGANDPDNGSFERLLDYQLNNRCVFYPIAIGNNADKDLLKSFTSDSVVLNTSENNIKGALMWLASCLDNYICCAQTSEGKKIIDDPTTYQLTIE